MPSSVVNSTVDFRRLEAAKSLKASQRVEWGQFFTPDVTARLMASMFRQRPEHLRILDAGAGVGSLLAALVTQACQWRRKPKRITAAAYEIDTELSAQLRRTVDECQRVCEAAGVKFEAALHHQDFISAAVQAQAGELFSQPFNRPNAVILNPPYKKINSDSATYAILAKSGIETTNLYSAFLWLCVRLLDDGGELVSITPRSFCNGTYFKSFRDDFLRHMAIRQVFVFESRDVAFKEDAVLQENIILHAQRSSDEKPVQIFSSHGPEDHTPTIRTVPYEQVVSPNDPDVFIRVVPDELEHEIGETVRALQHNLSDLNLKVSTGRVVDFRATKFLRKDSDAGTVPLIYPAHFDNGLIKWPLPNFKKSNAFMPDAEVENQLVPEGIYVLVKRFSSKEERRRIVASVYDPDKVQRGPIAFENHINYFHRNGSGLPMELALGLAGFLNSTLVDSYFRQFNGHTQVNAGDLRSIRYPTEELLLRLGKRLEGGKSDQNALDDALAAELNPMAKKSPSLNPIQAKRKLTEALDVLKQLNVPKAQQNDRSALTLLALLGLTPESKWSDAKSSALAITEMMNYFRDKFGKTYAPNSRESVRRFTVHQFVQLGLVLHNVDDTSRAVNSKDNRYTIEPSALKLLKTYGSAAWGKALAHYLKNAEKIHALHAKQRELAMIPVKLLDGSEIKLTGGGQNVLIKEIIEQFCPAFTPDAKIIYVGDAGRKLRGEELEYLRKLGVTLDEHGKIPDVIVHMPKRKWLVLIEAVTSHGPVDLKRHNELKKLFKTKNAGLVFVSAFQSRQGALKYLNSVSWETEVWVADEPTHIIHFNGSRFLGPYED